jgi:type IV pilus assembly protein PilC
MIFRQVITLSDKILFYESLSNLLDGWVTLLTGLKGFSERLGSGILKASIDNLVYFVENGDALNIAMRKIPDQFNEKEIAIIEAGEQTGLLKNSFESVAIDLRMQEDLRRKIIWALTYPVIIVFFLLLAFLVVMTYVIPQILPLLVETTTELSFATRSLIATSEFSQKNFWYIIAWVLGCTFMFRGYTSTSSGKAWLDKMLIVFPLFGRIYRSYLVVQVLSTFALLLSSGVSIVRSLRLTAASAGNVVIYSMFHQIAESLSRGSKLTESMKEVDPTHMFFGLDILQMMETGERTSTVHIVARKISEQYRREVDAALAVMVKFIEPFALLISGVFVLWFAVAIFSAIMQIVSIAGV